jgi:hypothetical protein
LFGQPILNARQTKWLEFLSECDFDIKHIKGKENKVVDALSRRVHEIYYTTINMCMKNLKEVILEVVASYYHYAQVTECLQ